MVYEHTWSPLQIDAIHVFFSYMFLMGLVKVSEFVDCWSSSLFCNCRKNFLSEIMCRKRFFSLFKSLWFSCPKIFKKRNPIIDVAQYFEHLLEICQVIIYPGELLAIDACLMLHKGRLHFREIKKNERFKFGWKSYCLCSNNEEFHGCVWYIPPYIG